MTTLDYQIGATGDDGYWLTIITVFFSDCVDGLGFGSYSGYHVNAFFRFPSVVIPAGATITAAKLSVYFTANLMDGAGTADVYAVDAASPSAISSYTDGDGRTKTTASGTIAVVTTGTWIDSSSLVTVIQELVDSYGPYSTGAIELLVIGRETGGASSYHDYSSDTAKSAKLHIEYTAGGSKSLAMSPRRRSFLGIIGR